MDRVHDEQVRLVDPGSLVTAVEDVPAAALSRPVPGPGIRPVRPKFPLCRVGLNLDVLCEQVFRWVAVCTHVLMYGRDLLDVSLVISAIVMR